MLIATSCSIPFENFTWFLCRGVDCQATMDDLGHQVCLGWRVSVDRKEPGVIQALEVKAVYLAQMALQVDQVCNYLIVCTCACVCVWKFIRGIASVYLREVCMRPGRKCPRPSPVTVYLLRLDVSSPPCQLCHEGRRKSAVEVPHAVLNSLPPACATSASH